MTANDDHPQIAIARAIATIAHRSQVDKGGQSYITHPSRVAALVAKRSIYPEDVAAAWLHDVLEDSDILAEDLQAAGVSESVVRVVKLLTRTIDVSAEGYYDAIRTEPAARLVKLADIEDNTSVIRLTELDDSTVVRLVRKYAKARIALGVDA